MYKIFFTALILQIIIRICNAQTIIVNGADSLIYTGITAGPLINTSKLPLTKIFISNADGTGNVKITPSPTVATNKTTLNKIFISNADGTGNVKITPSPTVATNKTTLNKIFISNADGSATLKLRTLNRLFGQSILVNIYPSTREISIREGGIPHCYLKLFTADGKPISNIVVQSTFNGNIYNSSSDNDGFVDVSPTGINFNAGDKDTILVTQIDTLKLIDAGRIRFIINVLPGESKAQWQNSQYVNLGISILKIEEENGANFGLIRSLGNDDTLEISRQLRFGIGANINADVGIKAGITADNITAGIDASAGAGVSGMFSEILNDNYKFGFGNITQEEAAAQYMLLSNGIIKYMSGPLVPLYATLISLRDPFQTATILGNAYISGKTGIELKGGAQASATLKAGISSSDVNLGIKADASIGANGSVRFLFNEYPKQNLQSYSVEISGQMGPKASVGLTTGINTNAFTLGLPTKNLLEWDAITSGGIKIETFYNTPDNGGNIKGYGITIVRFLQDGTKKNIHYSITGSASTLNKLKINLANYAGSLVNILFPSTNSLPGAINSATGFSALGSLLQKASELQKANEDISVQYNVKQTQHKDLSNFSLTLKGAATSGVSGEVGIGTSLIQNIPKLVEQGFFYEGKYYPIENYNLNRYAPIQDTPQQILQKILDNLPPDPIKQALSTFTQLVQAGISLTITVGQSKLTIAPDALTTGLDAGIVYWNWLGNQPSIAPTKLKANALNFRMQLKKDLQQSNHLQYGIGGFYRLVPEQRALKKTSTLTIAYSQDEVAGIDETKLAMYYWDNQTGDWKYFGGNVDTAANTVTATIDTLFLYTLAPAMPQGSFGLILTPDSVQANGTSIIHIESNTILNNDSTIVSDNTLFTVSTTLGTITTADLDANTTGIQIQSNGGKISFDIKAPILGGQAIIEAKSLYGTAWSKSMCRFTDNHPPNAPVNLTVQKDTSGVVLSWNANSEPDISGYKIYFGTHLGGPYDGTLLLEGASPIAIGNSTKRELTDLPLDTTYYFVVTAYDNSGNESGYSNESSIFVTSVNFNNNIIPKSFKLYQNYPNPFNPTTMIKYDIPKSSFVTIKVYNILGQLITTLVNGEKSPGQYEKIWNAGNLSSGIYIYRIVAGDFVQTKKLLLLK